jgi:creatinine amidohydrolase
MDLAKLTWPEAAAVLGPDCVAILPVGCTEPHGPHLPLDTDVTIALAQARRAAELLGEHRIHAVVLPAVNYGVTRFTDGFAGRLSIQPATLWSILQDLVEALEAHRVKRIVFVNGHLEPAHVEVLRGVALDRSEPKPDEARVLFVDMTRRKLAQSLGEAFCKGDHAGRYETSLVLARDAENVREEVRASLPPVDVDLVGEIQRGAIHFVDIGIAQAYCGDPAQASAAEGRETVEKLAQAVLDSARATWPELFE